ncbi:MAG: hypothetical protein K2O60_01955 [Ruminococcus sp.]|nr:hypothetical protein [Ruminococcus sp.]
MKLNYRDMVILGVLLALAILIAGFMLLVKPKNQEIKDNKETLAQLQEERDQIDSKIAEIEPLKTNITDVYNETVKLTEDFVDYTDILDARKVDQYMQHFAEDCEVKVMNLSASDLNSGTLSYYYFTPTFVAEDQLSQADLNGEETAKNKAEKLESETLASRTQESVLSAQYTITVTAEDKENLWDYMKALEEQDETIIINSVSLTNVEIKEKNDSNKNQNDDKKVTPGANFVITLYSVYDLAKPDLEQK